MPACAVEESAFSVRRSAYILRHEGHMLTRDEKLTEIVRRLHEAAGENLESLILYGSAARGDYHSRKSDLNLLCVLKSASAVELARIAAVVRWWSADQREPAPHIFTREELARSADVFSIELFDIARHHKVLFGQDPVADIDIPMNLHRVQVEHELRTVLQKLRTQYLRFHEDEPRLREVYEQSISSVTALLRHFLIALGEDANGGHSHVYQRVAELTGADAGAFELGHQLRENHPATEIARAYGKYLGAIETVAHSLDTLVPKHEWQRVKRH
jgi:hypothetical protein